MDETSLTLGWLVGRQIAGQRRTQEKQPVAYLYNGVQLPPLPERDKTAYPYALIFKGVAIGPLRYYSLSFLEAPLRYGTVDGQQVIYAQLGAFYTYRSGPAEYKQWEFEREGNLSAVYAIDNVCWTNHDVISDLDGSAYLAASDPIPVYA